MKWRVYVGVDFGDDDPDWVHVDARGLTYAAARELMIGQLARWQKDECGPCRENASEGLARLMQLGSDAPFEWEVEGDDYLLVRDDGQAPSKRGR